MKVFLNSEPLETSKDRISEIANIEPTEKNPIVIERKMTRSVLLKNLYEIDTNKGTFTIETFNNRFHEFFKENIENFKGLEIQWSDRNTINFGHLPIYMESTRKQFDYEKYTVLLGHSGFDKELGILTISKKGHIARNGIEKSVFGKVTKGRHVLELLSSNDKIEDIREVEIKSETYEYSVLTNDASIEENDNIITKSVIEIDESCPFAAEHFLFLTKEGYLEIDEKNVTYCRNNSLKGVSLPQEADLERSKGSISVRNSGKGKGCIYIYFKDTIEDKSHSVIGKITKGLELPLNLSPGQQFKVEPTTKRINTLGLTQGEAEKITEKMGIEHQRSGNDDDNAIIIEQDPEITIDAIKAGKITTKGVDPALVFKLRLFQDKAPNSAKYFKTISGLATRQLGRLEVLISHEDLDMIMFKGDAKLAGELAPENPPENGSKKGRIGITNMASRQRGIIGVRFNDSSDYGPTGEDDYHTNCIGEIVNYEMLRGIKEGSTIYLLMEK